MIELILGGARSGKSAFAEQRATALDLPVTYIATAEAGDGEMAARIQHHQARRPAHWGLLESPLALGPAIAAQASAGRLLLVDCITLWLSNVMLKEDTALFANECAQLLDALAMPQANVILVSNEVGSGIVPMNALARQFADEQGRINQQLAALAHKVTLVVAGIPVAIKG